ncbi:MAG: hypothetical protein HWD84_07525 [Flavobacteriaceae bacterium]|nr:hypothetical protein [Flavobacteriaceae bacterium]
MVNNAHERTVDSDVIIAPHHGADDGSSLKFIQAVSPELVVFPAGGQYGHPRKSTVLRYKEAGVDESKMFRTDLCDSPQKKEWAGHTVEGQDDSGGDNDIDITLTKDGVIDVAYVSLDEHGY